jgi:hypothetical protein
LQGRADPAIVGGLRFGAGQDDLVNPVEQRLVRDDVSGGEL